MVSCSRGIGLLLLCFGALVPVAATARVHESPVSIEVLDDHGRQFRQLAVAGDDRRGVRRAVLAARAGHRYSIRVTNHSQRRVGLVVAVDGRNIISGEKSRLRSGERMYVLDPRRSAVYRGWRTRSDRVHRFYFTDANDSYAGAWGDHSAMGVIAVAVFPEREPPELALREAPPRTARPHARRHGGRSAEAGTGFGAAEHAPTRLVRFQPQHRPAARHFLKYEWRHELCRKGVLDCPRPRNRFWSYADEALASRDQGFAPYPPTHRR